MTSSSTGEQQSTALKIPHGSDLARLLAVFDGAGYLRREHMISTPTRRRDSPWLRERGERDWNSPPGVEPDHRAYDLIKGDQSASRNRDSGVQYHWELSLEEGAGYRHFLCNFYFAPDGTLLDHGVWE